MGSLVENYEPKFGTKLLEWQESLSSKLLILCITLFLEGCVIDDVEKIDGIISAEAATADQERELRN